MEKGLQLSWDKNTSTVKKRGFFHNTHGNMSTHKQQQKNTEYMGEEVFIKMKQLDFTNTQLVCYMWHKLSRKVASYRF